MLGLAVEDDEGPRFSSLADVALSFQRLKQIEDAGTLDPEGVADSAHGRRNVMLADEVRWLLPSSATLLEAFE